MATNEAQTYSNNQERDEHFLKGQKLGTVPAPTSDNHELLEKDSEAQHVELNGGQQAVEPPPYRFNASHLLAISGLIVGYMADVFVNNLAGDSMAQINRILGPDSGYIWIGAMFTVLPGPGAPFTGYISDIFGRRWMILTGAVLGIVGNAATANVDRIPRIFGLEIITAAGMLFKQVSIASIAEIVPRSSRPFVFGCFWASLAPAQAFTPVIASSILTYHSWRDIYWIPFAMNILCFFLTFLFYHPLDQHVKEKGKTRWQQVASLDYVGGALITVGANLALVGVAFGLFIYPWGSAKTIAPLVVGVAIAVCIVPWEMLMRKQLSYPLYPRSIFRNYRRYTLNLPPSALLALVASTITTIWPQQIQLLYTQDPVKAGWLASAPLIAGVFLAPAYGLIFTKFGNWSNWIITCLSALLTMFTALQAVVTPGSVVVSTVLACFVEVTWTGLLVGFSSVYQFVPHHYLATSIMTHLFLRTVANNAGALVYSLILSNKLKVYVVSEVAVPLARLGVDPSLIPQVLDALLSGSTQNPALGKLSPQALETAILGVTTAFVKSFKIVYYSSLSFGLFSTIMTAMTSSFGSELVPIVDVRLVEGAHINVKYDTGRGTIIDDRPWL